MFKQFHLRFLYQFTQFFHTKILRLKYLGCRQQGLPLLQNFLFFYGGFNQFLHLKFKLYQYSFQYHLAYFFKEFHILFIG